MLLVNGSKNQPYSYTSSLSRANRMPEQKLNSTIGTKNQPEGNKLSFQHCDFSVLDKIRIQWNEENTDKMTQILVSCSAFGHIVCCSKILLFLLCLLLHVVYALLSKYD